jgi:hypothetical protein
MPYTKTSWKDRIVERPLTFSMQNNADGTVTLIPSEGTIIATGTPITATGLNNLEKQYDEATAFVNEAISNLPGTDFITPTLLNGWVANSPSLYPTKFWKDKDGMVHYRLWLKDGASALNVVILFFPVGYRPGGNESEWGRNDSTTSPQFLYHVATNGELKILRAFTAGASIILTGSFKAVN